MIKQWFKNIGPGPLVAAAFIGPGTVTLCSVAGVKFGYNLLWAMLLSVIATVILQEMAARIGVVSQKGISEIIRQELKHPILKVLAIILVLSAIVVGNIAYEAGNISGGVLGLETILGNPNISILGITFNYISVLIGIVAFVILYIGNYKVIERVLISLVIIMSLAFLISAFLTKPDVSAIFSGLFKPNVPDTSLGTIIGLIGTTIVPYNLFLHAALVKEKWTNVSQLPSARKDTILAIGMGGLVSMSIIITAAASNIVNVENAADLAVGLEPLFGSFAKYILSIGLFAAGITSAITAPLAAAYVVKGCLGWNTSLQSIKFRVVWSVVLLVGVVCSSIGFSAVEIITFAQITNGILLPVIAIFLLWIMNKSNVLNQYVNSKIQNILGICIVLIMIYLSLKKFNLL